MTSTFLKKNFNSLNMTEEDKKKAEKKAVMKAKLDQAASQLRKDMNTKFKGSISDAEAELLKKSVPSDILKIKKLLEEENK